MRNIFILLTLIGSIVFANLPPTQLKGGNETKLSTTFNFNLGDIPVTRTGTSVLFGTIPVTQGGTSSTSLTQYSIMAGNGTGAVNMLAPAASGTILFSNGASAFPSFRAIGEIDVVTALGYTPLASSTAAIISTLGYTPLASSSAAIISTLGYTPANQVDLLAVSSTATTALNTALSVSATVNTLSGTVLYKANNLSDLANATTARTNLGLGSVATENIVPISKGGTSLTTTVNQGVLVGSGTTSYRVASPASAGAVLMQSVSGTTAFLQLQPNDISNLLINGGFETHDGTSFYGWTSSSGPDLGTWTNPSNWDVRYWKHTDTVFALGTDLNQTVTIPQSLYGQDCEFGFDYISTNTSGTVTRSWYVSGTSTVSGTFSASAASSVKAYLPCGSASDTTKVINFTTTNASASGVTSINNAYFGPAKSLVNGAIVGPWQTYTPTFTGLGTVTNINCKYKVNGPNNDINCLFTVGTVTGVEAQITLPNSLTTVQSVSNTVVGYSANSATSSQHLAVIAKPGVGYLNFGGNNGGTSGITPANGNAAFQNNVTVGFFASVPIAGQQGTGVSFDGRCPNDISCTNDFSSFVGSTGIVTQENLDFVSSCTKNSTGDYSCTFNTGVFSVTPNCSVSAFTGSDVNVSMNTQSTTTINYKTFNTAGSAADGAVTLRCSKQGSDYVAKKTIQGYLSEMVREHIWLSAQGTAWSSTANTWVKIPLSISKSSSGASYSFSSNCITIQSSGVKMYKITLLAQVNPANGETTNLGYSATSVASGAVQADPTFISASGGATDPNREMYARIYFDNFTFGDSVCAYSQITTNTRNFQQGRMVLEQLN